MAAGTSELAALLEVVARQFSIPAISAIVAIGAVTAMLGVLLNLILGLSRVMLAMGRRGDLPRGIAKVSESSSTPYVAVIVVGVLIALLTLIGNVKTTWSFSAFTVLVYYALTNLSAIQMAQSERLYPRLVPWVGLISCLSLAFWVEPRIWGVGLGFIVGGLLFRWIGHRISPPDHLQIADSEVEQTPKEGEDRSPARMLQRP